MPLNKDGAWYESTADRRSAIKNAEQAAFLERNALEEQRIRDRAEEARKCEKEREAAGEAPPDPEPESPVEPPPNPLSKLSWPLRLHVYSLLDTVERIEGPVLSTDFETTGAQMSGDRLLIEAAEKTLSLGLTCYGSFADGSFVLRTNSTGLYHLVESPSELTFERLLQIAGPLGWGQLEPLSGIHGDDSHAEQRRKIQRNYLYSIAMLSGATRLSDDYVTFLKRIQDEDRMRQVERERRVAEAAAAAQSIGVDSGGDDEEDGDGSGDDRISPELIGK